MTTQTKYLLKDSDGDIWIGKLTPEGSLTGCYVSYEYLLNKSELREAAHDDYSTALKVLREFHSLCKMAHIYKIKIVPMIVKDGDA